MKVVRLKDVPYQPVDMQGAARVSRCVPIGKADGAPRTSVRVFTMQPGGPTPYHAHAWEHTNYIISGAGELVDADGIAHPLRPGDFALVLPNEKHQYRNASDTEPFVMICAVSKDYE
jgi:quercetin dioxygenase-like cupin family protein